MIQNDTDSLIRQREQRFHRVFPSSSLGDCGRPDHPSASAFQEVGSHQKLQSKFRLNFELRNLAGRVRVLRFVVEVFADLFQDERFDIPKVDLILDRFGELACMTRRGARRGDK
jgi:hypothetical protein